MFSCSCLSKSVLTWKSTDQCNGQPPTKAGLPLPFRGIKLGRRSLPRPAGGLCALPTKFIFQNRPSLFVCHTICSGDRRARH
jgi:hypothetical protein